MANETHGIAEGRAAETIAIAQSHADVVSSIVQMLPVPDEQEHIEAHRQKLTTIYPKFITHTLFLPMYGP